MIIGIGIDVADTARFDAALRRTPRLRARLFTPSERERPVLSLAARFAAKEAVAKALAVPAGLRWRDAEVTNEPSGRPTLSVSGTVAARAAELGVRHWHLSLSHDAGVATAMVIAEG